MRISDWSSDVCSSDLPAFGRDADARGGEPGGAAFGDIVQIDHRGPGALAALVLHPLPVIFAFMEIIVVRAEMLAGGVALARSEEHTSELQSLMRISYAVFCLQKKNNTTKPRHSYSILPLRTPTQTK